MKRTVPCSTGRKTRGSHGEEIAMRYLARRIQRFRGGTVVVACLAIAGCGGGSDDESRAQADAALTQRAAVRHALPYKRTGITAIVASPDGKSVAVAHSDGRVALLDAASHSEIKQLVGGGGRVAAGLVFSADGRYLVSVDRDSSAQVWDVDTGTRRLTLQGHEHPLR
ncbi:MAG: hypothetical protein M3N82_09800, partial [Pseudomonadota bacterium]|nr:hypothetical protein [Pseudomonadota bacterium]